MCSVPEFLVWYLEMFSLYVCILCIWTSAMTTTGTGVCVCVSLLTFSLKSQVKEVPNGFLSHQLLWKRLTLPVVPRLDQSNNRHRLYLLITGVMHPVCPSMVHPSMCEVTLSWFVPWALKQKAVFLMVVGSWVKKMSFCYNDLFSSALVYLLIAVLSRLEHYQGIKGTSHSVRPPDLVPFAKSPKINVRSLKMMLAILKNCQHRGVDRFFCSCTATECS